MNLFKNKDQIEVGVDEAGRGCLISRVYTGAVIWPQDSSIKPPFIITDSKKITKRRRKILQDFIHENAISYATGYSTEQEIDEENILQATMKAMHRAINSLSYSSSIDHLLIDGPYFNEYYAEGIKIPHSCICQGDSLYTPISCASILAKEAHDEYINNLCDQYPELEEYGLRKNVGYGTKQHREAIDSLGVTEFHRKTFAPCKNKKMNYITSSDNI
jgi:ribonuclease HII